MGTKEVLIKKACMSIKKMAKRLGSLHAVAYICIATAIAGSFLCGTGNLFMWCMLMFHSYTDIRTMELYVFPIRICIVIELLCLFVKYGFSYEGYMELLVCLMAVFFLKLFKLYAQGDAEIFFMLIIAAALNGKDIVNYSWRLVYGAMAVFAAMFCIYVIIDNINGKARGQTLLRVKRAPMVPAISIAYMLCCVIG